MSSWSVTSPAGYNFDPVTGNYVSYDKRSVLTSQQGVDLMRRNQAGAPSLFGNLSGGGSTSQASGTQTSTGGAGGSGSSGATLPANLSDLTAIADPWSSQRAGYQSQLSDLMKNPDSILSSPMFKSAQNSGIDAINRSAAAKGQLTSGNRLTALMDYGQGQGSNNFFKMAGLLGQFGGANNQNPGGGIAASASLQNADTNAYNAQTGRLNAGTNLAGQQLNQTKYDNTWAASQQADQETQSMRDFLRSLGYGG